MALSRSSFREWRRRREEPALRAVEIRRLSGSHETIFVSVSGETGRPKRARAANGRYLDKVWAGAEVVREVSSCGEPVWWPTESLDMPAAFPLSWDATCDEATLEDDYVELALVDFDAATALEVSGEHGLVVGVLQDLHADVVNHQFDTLII